MSAQAATERKEAAEGAGSVFKDPRIDQLTSWLLLLVVAIVGYFIRDTLSGIREDQRAQSEHIVRLSAQIGAFQTDLAVLQANYAHLRDVKVSIERIESRILELERRQK